LLIPNLLQRQFTVTRPNKASVTDITYIRTWQGWLYLAVVMDLFSRKIALGPEPTKQQPFTPSDHAHPGAALDWSCGDEQNVAR
jgi:hypothetical protein